MGLIVYGHAELDAAVARYDLGHAHVTGTPPSCREPVGALAAPWTGYLRAASGGVRVDAGPALRADSALLGDGDTLGRYAVAAVDALTETLAGDPMRVARYGDRAADGLVLRVHFEERARSDPEVPAGGRLALVRIQTPPWTPERYWTGRDHWYAGGSTTIRSEVLTAAVQRAWDGLAAPPADPAPGPAGTPAEPRR